MVENNVESVGSNLKFRWIYALAGIGFLDSIWLLFLHLSPSFSSSVCSLNATITCEGLTNEKFSEWGNIPVALFSVGFYWVALGILWFRKHLKNLARGVSYLWFLSWVSLLASLYMSLISVFFVRSFCPYCSILWMVSVVFFFLSFRLAQSVHQVWPSILWEDIQKGFRTPWFWGVGVGMVLVLLFLNFAFRDRGTLDQKRFDLVFEESRSLGFSSSPIVITEFSDFQCPYCRMASETLKELEREERGKVRIVFKFYPLDKTCNHEMRRQLHDGSCRASEAAYCAGVQGKFWPYHDLVFFNVPNIGEEQLLNFAQTVGLDLSQFKNCLESSLPKKAIQKDLEEGSKLLIDSTPTLFINGQKYNGPLTLSAIRDTFSSGNEPRDPN